MLETLCEDARRAAFASLVAAQDGGASVHDSCRLVAAQYGLAGGAVAAIEAEGLVADWPPLSDGR